MPDPNKFWELSFRITETAAVNMPQINNLKRNLKRKDNDLPPTPLRREDIPVLPERYQLTKAGEQFLIFDSGVGDNERILIFATQQCIYYLSNKSHCFMDGAFKLCPEIFYQIYNIHALNNNQVFSCVFALLPDNQLFREVRNDVIRQGNEPTNILINFEGTALNAVTNHMPQLQVLKVILYTVVTSLYLLEYLADSFSDCKCACYCWLFCFGMGFYGESIFGMLFSPPTRFYSFYIIRNYFIRNQLVDFG